MKISAKSIFITTVASIMILGTGCTSSNQTVHPPKTTVSGVIIASYSYPFYYDRPYYFYNGIYYYGGYYLDGYYYFKGLKLYGGHYFYDGYRYHHHKRYRAVNGEYGYYINKTSYYNSPVYQNAARNGHRQKGRK